MNNLTSQEQGLAERISWLIRLRWIAVAGVLLAIAFSDRVLKLSLPVVPLYTTALAILIYNLAFSAISKKPYAAAYRMANLQISLDLVSLAALIHFSGGIENPFIFYFLFHMIIASILLSRRASFMQATFAVFLFCLMVILEYAGILKHHCLEGFIIHDQHTNPIYITGIAFAFISTLYIAVYMASSISNTLRERERALREANELLNEKDRLKSEYVLRVTHDIKEHLAAIQSCLEPVSGGITGELNPGQKDLITRAGERAGKLILFVKALLEITRIRLAKRMEKDYFSVRKTVENAVNLVEAAAGKKGIAISYSVDGNVDTIRGAQAYIEEALVNLLANSVKYTPEGGKIDISVKGKDGSILFAVADTGIGMHRNEIPMVFEEFYRGSNAKELERDGTGLGLSIAKQIVERHNGKIWAESEKGKGSTFFVMLPKGR